MTKASILIGFETDDVDVLYLQDMLSGAVDELKDTRAEAVECLGEGTVSSIEAKAAKYFSVEIDGIEVVPTYKVAQDVRFSQEDIRRGFIKAMKACGVSRFSEGGNWIAGRSSGKGITPYIKRLYDVNYRASMVYKELVSIGEKVE